MAIKQRKHGRIVFGAKEETMEEVRKAQDWRLYVGSRSFRKISRLGSEHIIFQ